VKIVKRVKNVKNVKIGRGDVGAKLITDNRQQITVN
jgi:hypothetical protein